jgi:hypothetical protein
MSKEHPARAAGPPKPLLPPAAEDEIMDVLSANMRISSGEIAAILKKHGVSGDMDALQDSYRKRLGQRLMASIRDESGKREVLARCSEYIVVECCADRQVVIDESDAEIVRKMFEMRASGYSLGTISNWLYESKIPSPTGKARWSRETISKLLRNEKYTGDVLLQKTFVEDLFSGKQAKNKGELEKFLIHEHHPAIISRELFEIVNQL